MNFLRVELGSQIISLRTQPAHLLTPSVFLCIRGHKIDSSSEWTRRPRPHRLPAGEPETKLNGPEPPVKGMLFHEPQQNDQELDQANRQMREANMSLPAGLVSVRGAERLASDTRERYRQKLARITLDSMVQFVGLLDAKGTVLEINRVALDGVGIELSDVEGQPFWDVIDASLRPVKDEHVNVVFITAEGRDITGKKAQERETRASAWRLASLCVGAGVEQALEKIESCSYVVQPV